ncbi:endonuclease/exonuclease/phosphatase family protein [Streptomyces sp. NPDC005438]|uniref:endonuclease/exonuclease/phosphatase family protein n=1 Tax=Streptomyces sp. NPDC005438 TaxID=3156880 RepID=UPI0033B9F165
MQLPSSRTEPGGAAVVRLLSYNIRSMRDDRHALARVVRACAPDVLCVQEAPRFFRWRKHAAWLARSTDLVYVTGGATACGPMILTSLRATVEETEDLLLPRTPGLHQRGFATARLRFGPSARLSVLSCHLSLASAERRAQTGLLLDRVRDWGGRYTVVAGDLNERPHGRSYRRLARSLQDGWTVSPWGGEHTSTPSDPHQRIDAVLATEAVQVLACGVPRPESEPGGLPGLTDTDLRAATDHLPVLAVLRVPAGQ